MYVLRLVLKYINNNIKYFPDKPYNKTWENGLYQVELKGQAKGRVAKVPF